jgi:two-component sensor histidine kinase
MEKLLLRLIGVQRQRTTVRYGFSAVIVGCAALIQYAASEPLQHYRLLLFFPAVLLCSLLFCKGSGIFAALMSALAALLISFGPRFSTSSSTGDAVALAIFVLVGCATAAVSEALRKMGRDLATSERRKSLLLEELAHRTNNDLAILSSAIALQARASDNDEVRQALETANARVQVVASAHSRLRASHPGAEVELSEYLEELCRGLGDMHRGVRPIAVRVTCAKLFTDEPTAILIGLIINELVTNSLKYAFPESRGGVIEVDAQHTLAGGYRVAVTDNGIGCPGQASGLGTRLVRLLAKQRGGHFERNSNSEGCEAITILPESARSRRSRYEA